MKTMEIKQIVNGSGTRAEKRYALEALVLRRTGTTTRRVDGMVQQLFDEGEVDVWEGTSVGEMEHIFQLFQERMMAEHPSVRLRAVSGARPWSTRFVWPGFAEWRKFQDEVYAAIKSLEEPVWTSFLTKRPEGDFVFRKKGVPGIEHPAFMYPMVADVSGVQNLEWRLI